MLILVTGKTRINNQKDIDVQRIETKTFVTGGTSSI